VLFVFWVLVYYYPPHLFFLGFESTLLARQLQHERLALISTRRVGQTFFVFVLLCRHTASAPGTAGTHTGGVQ